MRRPRLSTPTSTGGGYEYVRASPKVCMLPPPSALSTLKLVPLKLIAVRCGINSTGTKAVLRWRLESGLRQVGQDDSGDDGGRGGAKNDIAPVRARILSIDMGIRNLAYCVIDVPSVMSSSAESEDDHHKLVPIQAWRRIAITSTTTTNDTNQTTKSKSMIKESFEPSIFADHAYNFLVDLLRTHSPTQVLIERQRYRSMGSSTVLEWTVRVNMFEGMLYAVLRTLSQQSEWSGHVEGVSPAKVSAFWLPTSHSRASPRTKVKNGNKAAKVDLVKNWLANKDVVAFVTPDARRMANAFLSRAQAKGKAKKEKESGRRKTSGGKSLLTNHDEPQHGLARQVKNDRHVNDNEDSVRKLDDLADCILQGIAWLRWEENKRKLLLGGPDTIIST